MLRTIYFAPYIKNNLTFLKIREDVLNGSDQEYEMFECLTIIEI